MEVKVPAKKVRVCDYCNRDGYLQTCVVCGREFCLICEGKALNPYHLELCRECIELPEVEEMNEKAGKEWRKSHDKLLKAMKARKIDPRPHCPKCHRKMYEQEKEPGLYWCENCNTTAQRKMG